MPPLEDDVEALRRGRLPRRRMAAYLAADPAWKVCAFSLHRGQNAACDAACPCRLPPPDARRAAKGDPAAATLFAAGLQATELHVRLARLAAGGAVGPEAGLTARATAADDALCLRARLLALAHTCGHLAAATAPGGEAARRAVAALAPGAPGWAAARPPRRARIHPLNLPDVVAATSHLNFDADDQCTADHSLARVLSKLVPCRCLFRGFADTVERECRRTPGVLRFVAAALDCSLAGAVPCADRVTLEPRMAALVPLVAAPAARLGLEQLVAWTHAHPHVLFYALKEVLCFLLRLNHPMMRVLQCVYDGWEHFEADVQRVCEATRAAAAEGRTWHEGLRAAELRLQRQTGGNSYVHKLFKGSFDDAIAAAAAAALAPARAGPAQAGGPTPGPGPAAGPTAADARYAAAAVARLTPRGLHRHYAALLALAGCAPPAVRAALLARDAYYAAAGSAAQTAAALRALDPADVRRVHMLAFLCKRAANTDQTPTDAHTAARQAEALARRLGRAPDRRGDGCVYFCPQCGDAGRKWKCPEDHEHNLYGIGPHDVYVDLRSKLRCNRKSSGKSCGGALVVPVCLVGRWFRFYAAWYTLCPCCAAPTAFDMRRMVDGSTFSCGRCAQEGRRLRKRRKPPALTAEEEHTAADVQRWGDDGTRCFYCNACRDTERTQQRDAWRQMTVAKDDAPAESVQIWLCGTCANSRASRYSAPSHTLGTTQSDLLRLLARCRRAPGFG
jgi:hypothetical protein